MIIAKQQVQFSAFILCVFLVAGCTTTSKQPVDSIPPLDGLGGDSAVNSINTPSDKDALFISAPEKKTAFISKPVVRNLLLRAKQRSDLRDYGSAIHLLERGVAISPNDPNLWQQMAIVRLSQGRLKQARQLAKKSNALVEADEKLRTTNLNIIEEATRRERVQSLGGTVLH